MMRAIPRIELLLQPYRLGAGGSLFSRFGLQHQTST
jgi:hypothetical protein